MNVLMSTYSLHQDWIKKYLEPHIHGDSQVAILPFSFSEEWISSPESWDNAYNPVDGKYYNEIVDQFKAYGITESQIAWLNYFKDSPEDMKSKVMASDILFLTGGLPEKAAERIESFGLTQVLKDFSGHIIGASAGALIQLPNYFVSIDADYSEFAYHQGLGLVSQPYYIEVHYEGLPTQKDAIEKALNERAEEVYALGDQGAIILHNNYQLFVGDVNYYATDRQ